MNGTRTDFLVNQTNQQNMFAKSGIPINKFHFASRNNKQMFDKSLKEQLTHCHQNSVPLRNWEGFVRILHNQANYRVRKMLL